MHAARMLAWLRGTYIAAAMAKPENRLAAVATLGVALGVALFSQLPLPADLAADLSQPRVRWGGVSASYLGFGPPSRAGRPIRDASARVVWNRPLPSRFVLVVEAKAAGAEPRELEIAVGDTRRGELVSPQGSRLRLPVEDSAGAREVQLRGAGIRVSRLAVEPQP